ncbi:hypothetical protein DSM107003_42910 [Trichormus variabilis SAG 1403-4b]|uniref:Uncharacterized protein n=1 Tax=Trichormus variabilis SAG 1403-4b TaxID=447716 RepID=A0A3S1BYJ9_ANAVA|nr:hypothetical protein DSM107003_42910 [Trichormus variabilis SAG 1403-4b]
MGYATGVSAVIINIEILDLGDGVATSFERHGYKQFTDTATLANKTHCESPHKTNSN